MCVCARGGGGGGGLLPVQVRWTGRSIEEGRLLSVENNVYRVYLTLFRDLGLRRWNEPTGPHIRGFPVVTVKGTSGNITEVPFVPIFVAWQPRTTEVQGLHKHLHPHSHSGMI